jgi:hypothetical protein
MSVRSINENKHVIDFYESGRKSKRHQVIFHGTRIEALGREKMLRISSRGSKTNNNTDLDHVIFSEAIQYYKENSDTTTAKEMEYVANLFVALLAKHGLDPVSALSPAANIFIYYADERSKIVSPFRVNRELLLFKKMHNYWVSRDYCDPLQFDLSRFYVKEKKNNVGFSEHFFEQLIENYPEIFLGEKLTYMKPPPTKGYIPDSLFVDENGDYVVVEIQKERLDRVHAYKILEYRDKLELELNGHKIRMMEVIIGTSIPADRDIYLTKYGVELKILPLKEIEDKILAILTSVLA